MCARICGRTRSTWGWTRRSASWATRSGKADLVAASIDEALGADNDIIARGSLRGAVRRVPRAIGAALGASVAMLQALLDRPAGLRGGDDAVDWVGAAGRRLARARELLLAYEGVLPRSSGRARARRPSGAGAAAADAVEALGAFRRAPGRRRCATSRPW